MAQITLKGNPFQTVGELPAVGSAARDFDLTKLDLSQANLAAFAGKKKILNIFPSVDTPVCAVSVKTFFQKVGAIEDAVVLNISADLPFAQKRFCAAEGLEHVDMLSTFRSSFTDDYQVRIADGPLAGLCSRAVVVVDENDTVVYTEQVPEIGNEPKYDDALAAASQATSRS